MSHLSTPRVDPCVFAMHALCVLATHGAVKPTAVLLSLAACPAQKGTQVP